MSKTRASDARRRSGLNLRGSAWGLPSRLLLALAVMSVSLPSMLDAQTQTITFTGGPPTVLGGGFNNPAGVAVDTAGDVFVADNGNGDLKEIVAVNGAIPANATILTLSTGFSSITGVAVDAAGDVFVVDTTNNAVEEFAAVGGSIPANPTPRTLGGGYSLPVGVAVDTAGDVFVADQGNNAVKEIIAVGGSIPATNPTILTLGGGFLEPQGVAVDAAGDVFVADQGNNAVKEIPASCIAGGNNASCVLNLGSGFFGPTQVVVDTAGDVFVAADGNNAVKEIVAVGGAIPANPTILTLSSGFSAPFGVALGGAGDVFVGDSGNNEVKEIQLNAVNFGGINVCPATVGAPAPCTETLTLNYNVTAGTTLLDPVVTTVGAPNLDFTGAPNSTCAGAITGTTCVVNVTFTPTTSGVREGAVTVTQAGGCIAVPCDLPHVTVPIFGTGLAPEAGIFGILSQIQPATASLDITGVAVDGAGNYYYSDQGGNTVYKVANGQTTAVGFNGLNAPQQLAIDGSGAIYVQTGESQIIKLAANGVQTTLLSTVAAITPNLEAYLENIGAFALDPQGDIYVGGPAAATAGGEVVKLDTSGNLTVVGTGYGTIQSMTVGADGTVYIVSTNSFNGSTTVSTISPGGKLGTLAVALPPISAIAVDAGGTVYLAEDSETAPFISTNLLVIDATGVETNYGMTGVDIPNQMAITPTGGLYIANVSGAQLDDPVGNIYFYARDASGGFGFNDVPVGMTSTPFPEPVLNIGNEPLTIFGLTYAGPFREAPVANSTPKECAATLAGGATCVVSDVFAPTAAGAVEGSFTLADNSLNATEANPATQIYALFGTGILPPVAMALTGPVPSPLHGSVQGTFTVTEIDATGAPAQGDNNTVTLSLTGPQEYDDLQVTLANGVGTLQLTLVEGGNYTLTAVDATNGLTGGPLNFPLQQNGGPQNFAGITLAASTTAPYYFDQVVITATINGTDPPAPTGSVSYSVDNGPPQTAPLNVGPTGAVNPGTASFLVGPLALGNYSVSVTYAPTGNFYLQSGPQIINLTVTDPLLSLVSSERLQAFANAGTPDGVAVDGAGDIFLADTAGAQVLEYTPAGARVVLPLDLIAPNGLAVDSFGNVYVSDSTANQVYEYNALTGQQTLSFEGLTPGTLNNPGKLAVGQNGAIYVADTGNNRVVYLNGDSIPNVVPATGLNAPQGVAVDAAGNVYIADTGNYRVIKIDANQNQTTIFNTADPIAVTVDVNGNIYVLDGNGSDTITRIDTQGHQVQLNGVGAFNNYNLFPVDIAADTLGNLFVPGTQPVTPGNQTGAEVLVISTNPGIKVQDVPVGGNATAVANYLVPSAFGAAPSFAATDLAGNNEFAGNQQLSCANGVGANGICSYTVSFNPILPGVRSGSFTLSNANGALRTDAVYGNGLAPLAVFETFPVSSLAATGLTAPGPIAVDSAGNTYVADTGSGSIFKIPAGGGTPAPVLTGLAVPAGVAVDGIGNVYAIDSDGTMLYKVAPGGNTTFLAIDLSQPSAIAVDGAGNVFVGETTSGLGEVVKIDPLGNETVLIQGLGFTPTSLALDSAGNAYVLGDGAILKVTPYQNISQVTFNDENVTALAVDAAGEIYAVDPEAQQIVRQDTAGNLTGSGGLGVTPGGLALDGAGNIYFTSSGPGTVSEITRGVDATNFGGVAVGATSMPYYSTTTNIGNQPLVFTALTVPAPFVQEPAVGDLTSCSGTLTLAAGTDCTLGIAFAPTALGLASATGTLTNNSLNGTNSVESVNLQGTGSGILPVSLTLTGPTTGVAGAISGTYTITELGANGVAATGDSDVVLIKSALAGPISGPSLAVTLTDGVGTFTIQYPTVATGPAAFTIAALDASNNLGQNLTVELSALQATTLALTASPAGGSFAGQSVTLTATLTPFNANGLSTDGETVTFQNDGVALGTGTLAGGVATFTTSALPVSADLLTAIYGGDTNFAAATSNSLGYSVLEPATTLTTLALTSGGTAVTTVAAGKAVTLTATVKQFGTGDSVTPGLVKFCNAGVVCENSALLGTAQLTAAGTAAFTFVPGIGIHRYTAYFAGTNGNSGSSSTNVAPLTVTGLYPTTTTIQATGSAGNYTLTGTVVGTGSATLAPTGLVSFLDASNGNASVGSATLGASAAGLSFVSLFSPATGENPQTRSAIGDFNGDGILDVATANTAPDENQTIYANTVTISIGNGDGTFLTSTAHPATGVRPTSIVAADFNGDDKLDLATANSDGTVTVLLGNGDGTFIPAASPTGIPGPYSIVAADFNGDGNVDLAVSGSQVTILLGNGDGTFGAPLAVQAAGGPMVGTDFNGDGKADLAVLSFSPAPGVVVLIGNGDGTFVSHPAIPEPGSNSNLNGITAGDFNGDGKLDIALTNGSTNTVTILTGNGDGTFMTSLAASAVGVDPIDVQAADFNGDGKLDLVVANFGQYATVLLGNGDGTFTTPAINSTNVYDSVAVGDFNGDGIPDVVAPNGGASLYVALTQRTQTATATLPNISITGVGTHNVQASFPANANFAASVSPTTLLTGPLVLEFSEPPPAYLYAGSTVGAVDVVEEDAPTDSTASVTLTVTGPNGYSKTYGPTALYLGTVFFQTYGNPLTVPGTYTYTATSSDGATEAVATEVVVAQSVLAPSQPVGTSGAVQMATLVFNSQATLSNGANAIQVVTQGVPNLDFKLAPAQGANACIAGATYNFGQSCTEAVVFTPTAPGLRLGAVLLNGMSDDNMYGTVVATAFLSGVGQGPVLDFNGGAATTLLGAPTLASPEGIAVDADGNVFVADSTNKAVLKIPAGGGTPATLNFADLTSPVAVAVDGAGDVYVVDQFDGGGSVDELAAGGTFATRVYGSEDTLSGIAVDGAGNVYVSDQSANTVEEILANGTTAAVIADPSPLNAPQGLAIDAAGDLFIADSGNNRIIELVAGTPIPTTTLTPVIAGLASAPNAVAVDAAGDLYIAESLANAVVETNPAGAVQFTLNGGNSGISAPLGVAVDGLGDIYVAGSSNQAAVEFPRSVSSPIAFGTQASGTTSSAIVLQGLQNAGNQTLVFSSITAGANFTVDAVTTTCLTTVNLAVGATCNLGVDFSPAANTVAGTVLTGSLSLVDNAPNTPQAISLSGTAGTPLVSAQTITLGPVANQVYGAEAFAITATASSGLPVTVAVESGPATVANNVVTITGVGTVVLAATQAGNASYSAAPVVTTSFTVTPATLTVTANSLNSVYGQALPALTDTITGFVYSDTAASTVSGAAALTTTATALSAPGSYPIAVAKGTLAAANYIFAFVPGTLTIAQATQTIAFTPIAAQIYGAAPFVVTATATSGLQVTISVQSGPATVAGNQVSVNGVGTVVLAGSQAGNADYSAAATTTTSFTVNPAPSSVLLSVTANVVRTPNPVSLSATVSSSASGETGTVTFLDGTTVLGQSTLSASDTAALSGVTLAIGTHTITASYSGTADFAASTSTAATVVVEPLAVILNTISPTVAEAGSSDTTITATGTNFSPTSVVNFNGTPLGTTFVNSTQLTAVVPAAQLATAGTIIVTVSDTYSSSTSAAQTFTILPQTSVTFTGPPTTPPGEQPTLNFQLTQPYSVALNGTMTLTFTPDPGNPDNPEVQFATGGRTFNFTLPPNTTQTPLILLQAGTTSGTITVSLQLTASGINVTPSNLAPITIVVPKVAPTVSSVTFSTSGDTLTVVVTGYSSTREIQSATFSFTPATGASLAEKSIAVPANTLFETWYTTAESAQYGSSFTYTQLFTLSGPATAVGGVGVTLTNTIGTSTEVTSQ